MASLKDMRNRIASVKATRKITKAMQMVAAAKLRRAQEAAQAARPYAERMDTMLAGIASRVTSREGASPLLVGTGKDDIKLLTSADYKGKWVVYFFYPKDFTFVCPTELAEFNKQLKAFKDRDTSVVGGSTDNEWSHMMWRRSHPDLKDLGYPLIAAQKLAPELGILEKTEGYCLRATFIVDPHGTIQWVDVNQGRVGRNVAEVLRVLDALQSDELCPCNWKKGDPYVKVG